MTTDAKLRKAAEAAGILTTWQDNDGRTHKVAPETLRVLLERLGSSVPADGGETLITAEARSPFTVGVDARESAPIRLTLERASVPVRLEGRVTRAGLVALAPEEPGYYRLSLGKRSITLAVAPARREAAQARRWGLSVQLYSLYRRGDGGIGSYGALRDFVRGSGDAGADALAVSPLHAQFSADPWRFSPYAPSSRLWLNVLHIDVGEAAAMLGLKAPKLAPRQGAGGDALIAWPEASRTKLKALHALFEAAGKRGLLAGGHPAARSLTAFRRAGGASLLAHATFEALHAHFFGADRALWNWRTWPSEFHDPAGSAVRRFRQENPGSVDFHVFLQWLAGGQFRGAAEAARDGKMAIGIIKDIAVGADGGWQRGVEQPGPHADGRLGRRAAGCVQHTRPVLGRHDLFPRMPCKPPDIRRSFNCCGAPCRMRAASASTTSSVLVGSGSSRMARIRARVLISAIR